MLKAAKKKKLLDLIKKYIDGTADSRESAFVEKYYHYFNLREAPSKSFSETEKQEIESRMLEKIHARIRQEAKKPVVPLYNRGYARIAAAAVLLMIASGTLYLYNHHPVSSPLQPVVLHQDIKAGTNGAILKLANGKTIVLDTAKNGNLWQNKHSNISKTDSVVVFAAARSASVPEYNTLITPRARQEQLVLADGTRVWLNAASSITFPTAFSGKQRVVEITGEAYFEVAEDVSHPFIVKVRDIQIKVLGTHFNVMAYDNERSLQTTLLEGSVKITQLTRHRSRVIKPGEQMQINNENGTISLIPHANVRLATAWKDGMQAFRNADIATIMRRVERWYNVDVIYRGKIPKRVFSGEIPRSASLAVLLKLFEVNKIHFTIDAKTRQLTVLP